MSDTPNTDPAVTEGQESVPVSDAKTVEQLPDWARKLITDANAEAAKYRVEKNDALANAKNQLTADYESKLTEANNTIENLKDQIEAKDLDFLKVTVALDLDVPSKKAMKFASLLEGLTEDDIRSHAKEVKSLFGSFDTKDLPTDPTQGTGSNPLPLNGDPLLAAVKAAVGVR